MEISRKVYIQIIKLIEETAERSNTQLADAICTLIEWIPDTNTISTLVNPAIPAPLISNIPAIAQPVVQNTSKKRIYEPYEKVVWGRVDGKWKFTPVPMWKWQWGIANPDGSLNVELTNEAMH